MKTEILKKFTLDHLDFLVEEGSMYVDIKKNLTLTQHGKPFDLDVITSEVISSFDFTDPDQTVEAFKETIIDMVNNLIEADLLELVKNEFSWVYQSCITLRAIGERFVIMPSLDLKDFDALSVMAHERAAEFNAFIKKENEKYDFDLTENHLTIRDVMVSTESDTGDFKGLKFELLNFISVDGSIKKLDCKSRWPWKEISDNAISETFDIDTDTEEMLKIFLDRIVKDVNKEIEAGKIKIRRTPNNDMLMAKRLDEAEIYFVPMVPNSTEDLESLEKQSKERFIKLGM